MTTPVDAFAADVGPPDAGEVVAVGGRTQWDVGGQLAPDADVRTVRAPAGVVSVEAADMTVRVRAGTTVAELDAALAEVGQTVALPAWPGATVGGVLAVGHSGLRRLGWGPVRDTVLEVRYASAQGTVVKAGGPTVKNVSGFDLCRLLVGSLGTLGLLAEVVLRTRPRPAAERWLTGEADPFALVTRLHRPAAMLWDGSTTWVLLDGHPADVDAQARMTGLDDTDGPPALPPHRWSLRPSALPALTDGQIHEPGAPPPAHGQIHEPGTAQPDRSQPADDAGGGAGDDRDRPDSGRGLPAENPRLPDGAVRPAVFVAEVGVGVVHADVPRPSRPVDPAVMALHAAIKRQFDPTGRLAPGRDPLAGTARGDMP